MLPFFLSYCDLPLFSCLKWSMQFVTQGDSSAAWKTEHLVTFAQCPLHATSNAVPSNCHKNAITLKPQSCSKNLPE